MWDSAIEIQNVLVTLITLLACYVYGTRHRSRLPPPPRGPRGLPILGNTLSIPSHSPWKRYAEWACEHNTDVLSIRTFGHLSVVIHTLEAAKELFEHRSTIYADRPQKTMTDLMGWDFAIGLMPYSNAWRTRRRLLHQSLGGRAAMQHRPLQRRCAGELMKLFLACPEQFEGHIQWYAAEIIMSMVYGHEIGQEGDRYIEVSEQATAMLSASVFPGAAIVNTVPILRFLPDWFPGAGFKAYAKKCALLTWEMRSRPFEAVKKGMADGTARPSMTSALLQQNEAKEGGETEEVVIMDAMGMAYAAGSDTTSSTLTTVILALVLHPDVQRRAQAEIDRVVGRGRLPEFGDALPYVGAICREASRWLVTLPLSSAHATYEDDVYNGQGIPKGTEIIMNAWAILHDPERYPDPESFKPERFLNQDGTLNDDEVQPAFGFGRRVCVGQSLATATVWIMVACTLAVYNIERTKDEWGAEIPVHVGCTDGMIVHPLPFACSFRPRDKTAVELIREA